MKKENREIKFRAWDKVDGFMYQNVQNGIEFEDHSNYSFKNFLKPELDDYHRWELMQFTGLKDKNGKEIYEGDVLKHKNGTVGAVQWDKVGFTVMESTESFKTIRNALDDSEWEVIGNIYENPELITN